MKNYLFDFYDESKTKRQRREVILRSLVEEVIVNGPSSLTFTQAAEKLNIERKTLYDYYPTKEDLIADLGFICINDLNDYYMEISDKLNKEHYNLSSKARLKLIMKGLADAMEINHSLIVKFLIEFDIYMHRIDKQSSTFLRYSEIIIGFKTSHHYLKNIVSEVVEDYNLSIEKMELVEITEQAFYAYLGKILIKENQSKRYKMSNLEVYIDIFVDGICTNK